MSYTMIYTFLTPEDRKALKEKAQKEHKTMAGYITEVLQSHIKEQKKRQG